MVERVVTSEYERRMLIRLIEGQKRLPFTVNIIAGKHRSIEQNRLQRKWVAEIAEQIPGESAEYWRGYCKLRFGVPIMRRDSEAFRERYDKIIKPLPYEDKIAAMMEPLDLPVTRIMKTKQKTEYLDEVFRHFTEQGVILTIPDDPALLGRRAA